MKTLIYSVLLINTMLLSTINAQTVSLLPSIKRNQSPYQSTSVPAITKEQIKMEGSSISDLANQVAQLEQNKKDINQKISDFFDNDQSVMPLDALTVKSLSNEQLIANYSNEAEALFNKSYELKIMAKKALTKERKVLLDQSKQFEEAAYVALINAAYLNASINKELYVNNKKEIEKLMFEYTGYKFTYMAALDKIKDAERYHRIGEDIRKESEELTNSSAKLGSLQNAEEKDHEAITLQEDVKQMFMPVCQK